ncbi:MULTISPECIES: flagellin [Thalassobaculum]|uniref:Flagellin n=1 Tax=Thalassobaculum litoreum DSM 18839 TaxID=1123362 RepID=A0A8G2BEX6_9PROT|nr:MULTISPECIES: flagellin [Thalassobaculum]SDF26200.1 flagellin [Thalassobaculum litoreum DSM 18839]
MTLSIRTNPEALAALRNLTVAGSRVAEASRQVSTGLKIRGAKDDASNFAIAQGLRSDVRALNAVVQGLNNAKGIAKVALAGATAVSDLMTDIRQKITEGANEGNTAQQQQILQNDYDEMIAQMRQILENSEFNGVNILIEVAIPFNLAIGTVRDVDVLSNLEGGTLTLNGQRLDVTYARLANEDISSPANALAALSTFETEEENVATALGSLGADLRALDLQVNQVQATLDEIEKGLGNIVDADMARASAELTAAQVRQQLSVQTLGVANNAPQIALGLFQ